MVPGELHRLYSNDHRRAYFKVFDGVRILTITTNAISLKII